MLDTLSSLSKSSRALSFAESWFSVTPERLAEYIAEVYAWTTVPIVPVVLFFLLLLFSRFFVTWRLRSAAGVR